jgi:acyl-CoA synthetase (AMP-forming)/AMP-acid ligase II
VGEVEPDQVRREARALLAAHKCPKQVVLVDELPTTSTGKLHRSRLAELVAPG